MKPAAKIAIAAVLIFGLFFMANKSYQTLEYKKEVKKITQKLPHLNFRYVKQEIGTGDRKVIVNHFSPDCEHCQYMAKQIVLNEKLFSNISIVMITGASDNATKKFSREYRLDSLSFLSIAVDTAQTFYKTFGTGVVPCFFIYDNEQKLVKSIMGETKLENLLN